MRAKLAAAALLLVVLAGCGISCQEQEGSVQAPEFTLKGLDGKPVSLSDFRGKVVFVDFWATWCPPCKEEMPSMARLYEMLGSERLEILAISEDPDPKDVAEFVDLHDVPFRILLDERRKVYELFGVKGLPAAFLIDANGVIRAKKLGAFDWASPSVVKVVQAIIDANAQGHARLLEPATVKLPSQ